MTLFENKVFTDVISLGSPDEIILDLGWTLNPMTGVFIRERRRRLETGTHREDDHVKTGAETGLTQPSTKEHQEPPEAGRVKEGFSSKAFRGNMALLQP